MTATILLLSALAAAVYIIFVQALYVISQNRLIDAQEEHITVLEQRAQVDADLLAWHAGYEVALEVRDEILTAAVRQYITRLPPASGPQQIEELRDRLAARSMN